MRLGELLKVAGMITESDIQQAVQASQSNAALVGKILMMNGLIEEDLLHAALRCQTLLRDGFLTQERAIVALTYCQKMQCSFDDALVELGWTAPTRTTPPDKGGVVFDTAPSS